MSASAVEVRQPPNEEGYSQIIRGPRAVNRQNMNNMVSLFCTQEAAKVFMRAVAMCLKVGKEVGIVCEYIFTITKFQFTNFNFNFNFQFVLQFVLRGSHERCRLMLCTVSEEDTTCFRIEMAGQFFETTSRFPESFHVLIILFTKFKNYHKVLKFDNYNFVNLYGCIFL